MPAFHCDGFRPIAAGTEVRRGDDHLTVATASDAAMAFGDRLARREIGRSAMCRHARLDSWDEQGTCHRFDAFIGRPVKGSPGAMTGRNVHLVVYTR